MTPNQSAIPIYLHCLRKILIFLRSKPPIFINSDLLPEVTSGGRLLPLRFQL